MDSSFRWEDSGSGAPELGKAKTHAAPWSFGAAAAAARAEAALGVAPTPTPPAAAQVTFVSLHLSRPLLRAVEALGYARPTPIQAACIPLVLAGRDVCGSAVTGSGKTAAYALPLLERLLHRPRRVAATRVLVLLPTRELAMQVHAVIESLARFTDVRAAAVVGGLSAQTQAAALRSRPDVVVATPGRLVDHVRNTLAVGLEDVASLVLDEADRLLEMGFRGEIEQLLRAVPRSRQALLFSATLTPGVVALERLALKTPARLASDAFGASPGTLREEVCRVRPGAEGDREAMLMAVASGAYARRTIVFARTKRSAHRLKILLCLAGLKAGELHGDMTQAMRLESIEAFRRGDASLLVATDVAARGLDIAAVEGVVSYDAPPGLSSYVHRVGRTARAGAAGRSLVMITEADRPLLKAIAKRVGKAGLAERAIPPAVIAKWRAKLESWEGDVAAIGEAEREERAMRRAEMEAQRAVNLLDHREEILGRPAKTWFQSERDKAAAKAAVKRASAAGREGDWGEGGEGRNEGLGRKRQRRERAMVGEAAKRARDGGEDEGEEGGGGEDRGEEEWPDYTDGPPAATGVGKAASSRGSAGGRGAGGEKGGGRGKVPSDDGGGGDGGTGEARAGGAVHSGIRRVKALTRQLMAEGMRPSKAASAAIGQVGGRGGGARRAKAPSSDGGLFQGDGITPRGGGEAPGAAARGQAAARRTAKGGRAAGGEAHAGGGGRKAAGAKKFKSKSKFKRKH